MLTFVKSKSRSTIELGMVKIHFDVTYEESQQRLLTSSTDSSKQGTRESLSSLAAS
ncbi:hypothetical protein Syun_029619 [Stephania yunnanensis]|uniref:Uncharacterized protein n=1 Tax=Stephania yunnanensis TaxID=152371 RepID=A0AAP0HLJ1_9MAGN